MRPSAIVMCLVTTDARGAYELERVRFDALNITFLLPIVKPGLRSDYTLRWPYG